MTNAEKRELIEKELDLWYEKAYYVYKALIAVNGEEKGFIDFVAYEYDGRYDWSYDKALDYAIVRLNLITDDFDED